MKKHEYVQTELASGKATSMKVFGSSMMPMIKSGSILTFKATNDYQVGDVVFCKVNGRPIDAHKISKVDSSGRYLISNNKGHDNGWTRTIYGRVIEVNGQSFGRKI